MNNLSPIGDEQKISDAHEYLKKFINKYEYAKRGGIHDFIEVLLANMIGEAINNIDTYMSTGHKHIIANEIMAIVCDSFVNKVDAARRNIENLRQVNFCE